MKRIIGYILLIIVFTFLGYIGMTNQPVELPNASIIGVSYYKYNVLTGDFNSITIDSDRITYIGSEISLSGCYSYKYQSSTGIVKMDCGRAFRLITPNDDLIVLNIDNNNYYFFKNASNSYAKEFQNTFSMTISDYEFEGNEKLEKIKIDSDTFEEFMNDDTESFVYIKNNVCTFECILLSNSVTDLSGNKNIYYIDSDTLPEKLLNQILEIDSDFLTSSSPKILSIGNGKIKNVITIPVKNFDINVFIGYLDDYSKNEVIINEEN